MLTRCASNACEVRNRRTDNKTRRKKNEINLSVRWVLGRNWGDLFVCIALGTGDIIDRRSNCTCIHVSRSASAAVGRVANEYSERRRDIADAFHSSISNKSKWLLFKVKFTFDPECLTQLYTLCTQVVSNCMFSTGAHMMTYHMTYTSCECVCMCFSCL